MTQPTLRGRKLPLNDWEGDDFTPGAGGRYVTCMDTAAGRAVAWATNGRLDKDGKVYRANVVPPDPNGVNFPQMAGALKRVNIHLDLVYRGGWTKAEVIAHLKAGKGLIATGQYDAIPRRYRYQGSGDFAHAIFISHMNQAGTAIREYDPLDPRTDLYGRHVPASILWPFLASGGWVAGFVPLHALHL